MSSRPSFFVPRQQFHGQFVDITDDGIVHQMRKVFRMRIGDAFVALDGAMHEYDCAIDSFGDGSVRGRIREKYVLNTEPSIPLTLCASLIRRERFADMMEPVAELGVVAVMPIAAERSPYTEVTPTMVRRWNTLLREGAEVSRRGRLPTLLPTRTLAHVMQEMSDDTLTIALALPDEAQVTSIAAFADELKKKTPRAIALFVGPEGDFTKEEYRALRDHQALMWSLGSRVLRSETAAMTGVGILAALL